MAKKPTRFEAALDRVTTQANLCTNAESRKHARGFVATLSDFSEEDQVVFLEVLEHFLLKQNTLERQLNDVDRRSRNDQAKMEGMREVLKALGGPREILVSPRHF